MPQMDQRGPTMTQRGIPNQSKSSPGALLPPPWVPRGRPEGTPGRPQGAPGRLRWLQGCILVPKEGPNDGANLPNLKATKNVDFGKGFGSMLGRHK